MVEDYLPHDQPHDDFHERFLEQKIGELNSFTEPLAEDPKSFPIISLRTAHKRDSVTSSD